MSDESKDIAVARLAGITPEGFAFWRHHPVSKVVLQFMRDRAAMLEQEMLLRWRNKASHLGEENEALGRVVELEELAELSFDNLVAFYQPDQKSEQEGQSSNGT